MQAEGRSRLTGTAVSQGIRPVANRSNKIPYPLTAQRLLSALLTFAVMATEFTIAISPVLPRWFRTRVLYPCGAALHFGIILFMGVSSFSMVMFAALTLLVLPVDTDLRALRRVLPRRGDAHPVTTQPNIPTQEKAISRVP